MNQLRSAQDILAYFDQPDLDPESREFLYYHYQRYEFLFQIIDQTIDKLRLTSGAQTLRILDIGPGFQTEILRRSTPNVVIHTLGFQDFRFKPLPDEKHFEFDLNSAQSPENCLELEPYDLVLMAEVIEHLYTSPALVLRCVARWMKASSYLILQTPNACALHKRLKMLIGKNPYDLIREKADNPGHFREYTLSELDSYTRLTGLKWVDSATRNYFFNGSLIHKIYNSTSRIMPAGLRQGITLILKKPW